MWSASTELSHGYGCDELPHFVAPRHFLRSSGHGATSFANVHYMAATMTKNILIGISVLAAAFLIWKYSKYQNAPKVLADACKFGNFSKVAPEVSDRVQFCNCFGSRTKQRISFLNYINVSDDEFSEVVGVALAECRRLHR